MQHNERETRESEDTVILKSEVLTLESKITEQHAQILRAKADLENNRRRAEKEIEKVRLYSLTKYNEAVGSVDLLRLIFARPEVI
ncbi:nucleotide exchange factor GrpE [Vibrio breoganii]|uniref:nucleotide exchange factor GrpE n=1 Tax=Vibrio breoganii TaxID=553239 RepID=UPI000C814A46|nr:nucleotide exchange factor GrpE [Vibrio breoganii]PML18250.1 nucleotide exchange factor GrpE [Vibrio breoganii]PML37345.1 nucleotide exchange factor GrpE [Vibrio breoganii]